MQTRAYWKNYNMTFRDVNLGPSEGGSFWQTCPIVAHLDPSNASVFYDDFFYQPSTKAAQSGAWTIVEDDTAAGTDAVLDARGGQYKHYCDQASDNDEAYLFTFKESWILTAGYSLWMEARVAFVEGSTNKGNFLVGMTDAAGADMIADDGAGPKSEYDGAVFWNLEGALTRSFETSNATTQSTATSCGSHVSGTFTNYGIWFKTESTSDTVAVCTPYIDGVAYTARNLTLSGLAEMEFCVGCKSDGTAEEAFIIDYVKIVQIRN